MLTFLYNLIIFPISQLIDICFVFFYRLIKNYGYALFGVSIIFSVLTLPFYFIAERLQNIERNIQKRMKPKLDKIKTAFSGDERYLITSVYYRQNDYHPIFALRSSLGLLIQIPFFIAAYSYISHLELINGESFLFIKDLGKPDGIISFNNININILPVIMTLINIISGIIYSKGFEFKNKIQLYGISLIFLILLYNSPSALVIYWTMNNIFSLFKNLLQRLKNHNIVIFISLFIIIIIADIYLLFFHSGDLPKRLLAVLLLSSVILLPFLKKLLKTSFIQSLSNNEKFNDVPILYFVNTCIILFLLNGIIVPSSLIASSVSEFSFIDAYSTPFPFLFSILQQSAGFFLFWPIIIFLLFSKKVRLYLSSIMLILATISIINIFTITENFGFFTTTMLLSDPKPFYLIPNSYILNTIILLVIVTVIVILLFYARKLVFISGQMILIIGLLAFGIINIKNINNDFLIVRSKHNDTNVSELKTEYTFSKQGKNVLIIMLDAVVGSHIPFIFDEKPELYEIFDGFTYYPNCVSFANHTLIGALPVFGGYEYTPESINNRNNELLIDKQQEAYLLLPVLFSNSGFSVTVTDPPFDNFKMSNLSIFSNYPDFDAKNLIGKYTHQWFQENKHIEVMKISETLKNKLIRFSFFKSAPLFLRLFIYDEGDWFSFSNKSKQQLSISIINDYAFLDTLNKITSFSDTGDFYISMYSHLPHDGAFLQAPDYTPEQHVTNRGTSLFANSESFHVSTASFLLLGKWFENLKDNGVYDNTRIIIVSDHGKPSINTKDNIRLPNNDALFSYNSLLMIKDFNSKDTLYKNNNFMTNGDMPLLALEGIIENPVNPFTKNILKTNKENGIKIATIGAVSTYRHNKYGYNLNKNQWLFTKENIFESKNWKNVSE